VFVQDVSGALRGGKRDTQVYIDDDLFADLGSRWWIPLCIFLALSLVLYVLMSRTVVGRHLYAMGGNEAAARLSGIRTQRLKWLAYSIRHSPPPWRESSTAATWAWRIRRRRDWVMN
jgi:ribose/xylose/arabinose/galactoside ABC-type transport system permease subunit